jgi:integral membrane sensor domain MASE1
MKIGTSPRARYLLLLACIAASYVLTAKLGFTMASVAEQVTVVWPPSGIALAACLLLGRRAWPGVWLGAFVANFTSHEPIVAALAIATGNTLEAVLGSWLLERIGGFDLRIGRLRDVLALGFLAAGVSVLVSATIGALTLCVSGLQPWSVFYSVWRTWWIGDAIGDLVVARRGDEHASPPRHRDTSPHEDAVASQDAGHAALPR